MKIRLFLCMIALLALFAAGCGSDGTDGTSAESATNAAAEDEPEAAETPTAEPPDAEPPATETPATETPDAEPPATETPAVEPTAEDDAADAAEADAPQRIISLNPTATEMLFAIGAGDQVVAVDEFSYFPAEAPVTDLSGYTPNIEAIAGFEPDLVVSDVPIEGLEAVGIPNHLVPAATTLDDIYTQIETLGALTGHLPEAAELVLQMQTDIEAALASVPDRDAPLTYYHELDNTLYSVTSTTFIGYVYGLFDLVNIADPADADGAAFGYPQLNEEFVITADPDIIFLADTLCCAQSAETVAARPGWDQLRAVQNGNVIELDDDVVSRWGPRIVDFVEAVAAAVATTEAAPTS